MNRNNICNSNLSNYSEEEALKALYKNFDEAIERQNKQLYEDTDYFYEEFHVIVNGASHAFILGAPQFEGMLSFMRQVCSENLYPDVVVEALGNATVKQSAIPVRPWQLLMLDRPEAKLIQDARTVSNEHSKLMAIANYMLLQAVATPSGAAQIIARLEHDAEKELYGKELSSAMLSVIEGMRAIEDGDLR